MWNIIWSFVKEQNLINALRENLGKLRFLEEASQSLC